MDSNFYKDLGNRLRIARNANSFSLETMSEQLSISYQQLQKYESGINRIPLDKLIKICNVCNIPMTEMFNFKYPHLVEVNKNASKLNKVYNPDAEVLELIRAYNELPRHIQESFLRLVKTLSKVK